MLFFCTLSLGICEGNPNLVYRDKGTCEAEAARTNQQMKTHNSRYQCFAKPTWQPVR